MSYDYGTTPISPMDLPMEEPPQKKPTTVIIIVVVLLVLCCCCLVGAGGAYWLWNNGDELFKLSYQLSSFLV